MALAEYNKLVTFENGRNVWIKQDSAGKRKEIEDRFSSKIKSIRNYSTKKTTKTRSPEVIKRAARAKERKYTSEQPHEKAYSKHRKSKVLHYKTKGECGLKIPKFWVGAVIQGGIAAYSVYSTLTPEQKPKVKKLIWELAKSPGKPWKQKKILSSPEAKELLASLTPEQKQMMIQAAATKGKGKMAAAGKAGTMSKMKFDKGGYIEVIKKANWNSMLMAGFKPDKLTDRQIEVLLQPIEAPEDYAQDGEITPAESKKIWLKRLSDVGFTPKEIGKAIKYIFGYRQFKKGGRIWVFTDEYDGETTEYDEAGIIAWANSLYAEDADEYREEYGLTEDADVEQEMYKDDIQGALDKLDSFDLDIEEKGENGSDGFIEELSKKWHGPVSDKERAKAQEHLIPLPKEELNDVVRTTRFSNSVDKKLKELGINNPTQSIALDHDSNSGSLGWVSYLTDDNKVYSVTGLELFHSTTKDELINWSEFEYMDDPDEYSKGGKTENREELIKRLMNIRKNWKDIDFDEAYSDEWEEEPGTLKAKFEFMEEKISNNYDTDYIKEVIEDESYAKGGKTETGYMVFNYTDNIYASPEMYDTKAAANKFIKEFRKRFETQGYYRDNRWNQIKPADIDIEVIPADFSPFKKGGKLKEVKKKDDPMLTDAKEQVKLQIQAVTGPEMSYEQFIIKTGDGSFDRISKQYGLNEAESKELIKYAGELNTDTKELTLARSQVKALTDKQVKDELLEIIENTITLEDEDRGLVPSLNTKTWNVDEARATLIDHYAKEYGKAPVEKAAKGIKMKMYKWGEQQPGDDAVDFRIEGKLFRLDPSGNPIWEYIGERKSEKAARNFALREVKKDKYQEVLIHGTNDLKYGGDMKLQLFISKEGKIENLGI